MPRGTGHHLRGMAKCALSGRGSRSVFPCHEEWVWLALCILGWQGPSPTPNIPVCHPHPAVVPEVGETVSPGRSPGFGVGPRLG